MRGAVRTSKLLSDGRRQIGAFYLPGDVFGLEAADHYAFSAEAIADTANPAGEAQRRRQRSPDATAEWRAQLWVD